MARGSIAEIISDVAHLINAIHTQFSQSNPVVGDAFKAALIELVASPETPLFTPQGSIIGVCINTPEK